MKLQVERRQILLSMFFLVVFSSVTVTQIYAEAQYTRSFTVTITAEKSFFGIFTWTEDQDKTVTATVSDESYRYWRSDRQRRWYGWHGNWWDYFDDYRWLVKVGAGHNAVKSIVTQLRVFNLGEEDYVNAVLQMVHQFTYKAGQAPKFAIETIVDGTADCDGFSVFVATILYASGYQVALIMYKEEEHMVAGVHLNEVPKKARSDYIYSFTKNGVKYYICEATGQGGGSPWRVGELGEKYQGLSAYVIVI
ncbi:hypothetical protein KEJ26_00400 [Candidatus Bathyarchaeota archaeon]|nr:hypothetical protein [Candidatus Bathyarchaeota archaeon]